MNIIKPILICNIIFFLGRPTYAQNFEYLTGIYQVTDCCENRSLYDNSKLVHNYFTYTLNVQNPKSDSLITLSAHSDRFMPFPRKTIIASVLYDSFDIFLQDAGERSIKIYGNGSFKADSIFLKYSVYDTVDQLHYYWVCESKGKWESNVSIAKYIEPTIYNIFFDHRQQAVIFEGLHKTLKFELYDLSGRWILTRYVDGSPLPIPNDLPNGIYPYRLRENDKVLQTGKILF